MKSFLGVALMISLWFGGYEMALAPVAKAAGHSAPASVSTRLLEPVMIHDRSESEAQLYAGKRDRKRQRKGDEGAKKDEGEKKDEGIKDVFKIIEGVGAIGTGMQGIDYESERAIGESLALEAFRRYGLPLNDSNLQRYVNLVGTAVARNSGRPNIPYRFVVVDSPLYNAFACPGGIIFVSSTLVKSLSSEAELAGVLSHEVAHVSHKHALETIRRAKFFEGVSKISSATMKGSKGKEFRDMIGDLQTTLFDRGLDQNMEYQADTSAMEIAYRTGYDPNGMIHVLQTLQRNEARAQKAGSWFSTHPPLGARINNCMNRLGNYPDARSLATLNDRFARYRGRIQ